MVSLEKLKKILTGTEQQLNSHRYLALQRQILFVFLTPSNWHLETPKESSCCHHLIWGQAPALGKILLH